MLNIQKIVDNDGPELYTMFEYVYRGWAKIFIQMSKDILAVIKNSNDTLNNFEFLQIKEKFGALRIYWSYNGKHDAYKRIDGIIDAAEAISEKTCHWCGKPATCWTTGWILPFCDDCAQLLVEKKEQPFEQLFRKS